MDPATKQKMADLRSMPDVRRIAYGRPDAWYAGINRAPKSEDGEDRPFMVTMDRPGGNVIEKVRADG